MSLILDALNRADNERKNQDAVPGLTTVHPAPAVVIEDKPEKPRLLYWAIGLSIAALGGSVYWFTAKSALDRSSPARAPQSVVEAPVSGEVSSPVLPQQQAQQQVTSAAESMVSSTPAESVVVAKPTAMVEQLYSAPTAQTPVTDPAVSDLYSAGEAVASESIQEPFENPSSYITDVTAGRASVDELPSRTFASITQVQDFNELPWNTKQQIPTISYQRHNYLAGGVSSVVINGQTLGEGNIAASSQLIVQEIFVDGVVLKRGNVVFKLRALNGWINM